MAAEPVPLIVDFNVDELIRSLLEEGAEQPADALASAVLAQIPKRHRDAVLADLLVDRVRAAFRVERRQAVSLHTAMSNPASSRWAQASGVAQKAEALRRARVLGQSGKPLADCDRAELARLVDMHTTMANSNARRAVSYERLIAAIEESGGRIVADLDDEAVVAAFAD